MTTKTNIPTGYKDSAVGVAPKDWKVYDFRDIASISKEKYTPSDSSCMPCVELEHISQGDGVLLGSTEARLQKSTKNVFKKGCVLFGKLRPYLRKYLHVDFDGVCSSEIWVLSANENICSNEYLYRLVSSDKYIQCANVSIGSKMPRADWNFVSITPFPVPPMEEQRKIAEILGVWDEAIEKQSRLIEKLELRKRALMQHLLTGRTRLPGFTTPWQKVKLGEIGKFDKGIGVPKEKIVSEGCKAITYGEIYTKYDYVIKDFASYIDSDTAQTSKQISSGAILFAGSGETLEDIGKCVAFIDNDKAYAGGDIIIFNPSIEVDSLVLSYILNSPVAIAQKRRYGQGHSVVHIYQKDLARIEFELPSLPEQKAIAEVLTTADDEIATHRKKLDALCLQKRGLMQQLLTGKTRVKI